MRRTTVDTDICKRLRVVTRHRKQRTFNIINGAQRLRFVLKGGTTGSESRRHDRKRELCHKASQTQRFSRSNARNSNSFLVSEEMYFNLDKLMIRRRQKIGTVGSRSGSRVSVILYLNPIPQCRYPHHRRSFTTPCTSLYGLLERQVKNVKDELEASRPTYLATARS